MKLLVFLVALLLLLPVTSYDFSETLVNQDEQKSDMGGESPCAEGTGTDGEYWALLVAVGTYANNPDMDRPSMFVEVDHLYNTLLVSEQWQEDHIKVITAENATVLNILQGFQWLDDMEDENDICLVYLTTHGFPILWDLPPFDEADGMDEALACYRGFLPFPSPWSWEPLANPFGILTDDIINYYLNRLETQGLCVVVDSCHSGGFNDNWSYAKNPQEVDFTREFAVELQGRNRVIMTSVPETETSYGSYFSRYLAEGLQGYGDADGDDKCSAEEAFWYAEPIIRQETGMEPQIFDDYPGELLLTEVELPPSTPTIEAEELGRTNTTYTYRFYSEDPENDAVQYDIVWGDGNEEYTGFYASGEHGIVTHTWWNEQTYTIAVRALDENGASSDLNYLTVTMADHHEIDQRQVVYRSGSRVNTTEWVAQLFVPTLDRISKIELNLFAYDESNEVIIMLRENLSGIDMVTASKMVEPTQDWEESQWISFEFNEVSLTPGEEYYIVCRSSAEERSVRWSNSGRNNDVYQHGTIYYSEDAGTTWESRSDRDATFVTYG